ncbi:hypothetical protein KI659_14630 [Litoribacter alkaliphilus]|uniref:Uncharacterized protein n=1 Tax=Litoribacter ruber TaxID=702568 RepID=A0AAP2CL47_9BACT|nr:hypothetical protein [Litoribacter alkaliphilus]MBS9525251.1 hypothetical protein [Litoribacter alkaliphilus]
MAKQSSIIEMTGNIGKLNFYKDKEGYKVRQREGVSKERIMGDRKFARTRENNAEFANALKAAKLIRGALYPFVNTVCDSRFMQRLSKSMVQTVKSDPVSSRGNRRVAHGDLSLLEGLRLNGATNLKGLFQHHYQVRKEGGKLDLHLQSYTPGQLKVPANTSHFRISLRAISFDVETDSEDKKTASSDFFPVEIPFEGFSMELATTDLLHPQKVYVVVVEFYQQLYQEYEPVAKGRWNVGEFV